MLCSHAHMRFCSRPAADILRVFACGRVITWRGGDQLWDWYMHVHMQSTRCGVSEKACKLTTQLKHTASGGLHVNLHAHYHSHYWFPSSPGHEPQGFGLYWALAVSPHAWSSGGAGLVSGIHGTTTKALRQMVHCAPAVWMPFLLEMAIGSLRDSALASNCRC